MWEETTLRKSVSIRLVRATSTAVVDSYNNCELAYHQPKGERNRLLYLLICNAVDAELDLGEGALAYSPADLVLGKDLLGDRHGAVRGSPQTERVGTGCAATRSTTD